MATSMPIKRTLVQTELFRPSLTYPMHPYGEMLTHTTERYPERVAVISGEVNLTYRELEALVNAFANALYVTITDRKKEMIKVKGFSVAPAQIEALFLEHHAVADVAVIAKPDPEAGEVPKAFVVLRAGYEQLSVAELMAWANGKLATFKQVREIEFIEAIPRNPSGKILRRVLKQREQQRMNVS